jgi:tetratricopeptide (TPR) repeat protein
MASNTQSAAATKSDGQKVKEALIAGAKGEKTWGEVLGINAGQAYNMAQMGYKLLQEGRLEEAQAMFQGLTTLNPKDAYMHLALGSCHHRADRVDEAIAEYSKAIEVDPKLANAYANRGELYIAKKMQDKAFTDLKKAVDLDPKGQDPSTIRARAILATAAAKLKEKAATGGKAAAAPKKK